MRSKFSVSGNCRFVVDLSNESAENKVFRCDQHCMHNSRTRREWEDGPYKKSILCRENIICRLFLSSAMKLLLVSFFFFSVLFIGIHARLGSQRRNESFPLNGNRTEEGKHGGIRGRNATVGGEGHWGGKGKNGNGRNFTGGSGQHGHFGGGSNKNGTFGGVHNGGFGGQNGGRHNGSFGGHNGGFGGRNGTFGGFGDRNGTRGHHGQNGGNEGGFAGRNGSFEGHTGSFGGRNGSFGGQNAQLNGDSSGRGRGTGNQQSGQFTFGNGQGRQRGNGLFGGGEEEQND